MPAEPRYLQEILAQIKFRLHIPNARGAFGSPPGGFHILGGNEFRLRQGFAVQNAWTPQSGGSLRS